MQESFNCQLNLSILVCRGSFYPFRESFDTGQFSDVFSSSQNFSTALCFRFRSSTKMKVLGLGRTYPKLHFTARCHLLIGFWFFLRLWSTFSTAGTNFWANTGPTLSSTRSSFSQLRSRKISENICYFIFLRLLYWLFGFSPSRKSFSGIRTRGRKIGEIFEHLFSFSFFLQYMTWNFSPICRSKEKMQRFLFANGKLDFRVWLTAILKSIAVLCRYSTELKNI